MSKISKKLLSLVIVLAMVLSMSPVISLPAAAAVTNPSEATDPMAAAAQNIADVKAWHDTWKATFSAEDKCVADATVEAPCPFCSPETAVVWTGVTTLASGLTNGCHLYLVADFDGGNSIVANGSATVQCVYTNQKTIGDTKTNRLRVRGGLNVIAYGSTFTSGANDASEILIQGAGVGSIYGGTFINNDPDKPLMNTNSGSMDVSLYDGTYTSVSEFFKDGTSSKTLNIYGSRITGGAGATFTIVNDADTVVNVYGNETYPTTITGGTGYVDGEDTKGGNVYVSGATFNLYGGSIYGGSASYGGNMYAAANASVTMSGKAKIYGGTATTHAGNVYVNNAEMSMSGNAEIYGGTAVRAGNIRLLNNAKLVMSGDSKVYSGTATSTSTTTPEHNIWGGGTAGSSASTLVMKDNAWVSGAVNDSGEGRRKSAIGMSYGTVVLMDNASAYNVDEEGNQIDSSSILEITVVPDETLTTEGKDHLQGRLWIDKDWTGTAYTMFMYDPDNFGTDPDPDAANNNTSYAKGATVDTRTVACGEYDEVNHTLTQGGSFAGNLYYRADDYVLSATDGVLTIGDKYSDEPVAKEPVFGTFDPAGCEGKAYCEACYKQALAEGKSETEAKAAALKDWTAYNYEYANTTGKTDETSEHLYLKESVTYTTENATRYYLNVGAGTVCFNLNGNDITKGIVGSYSTFCVNGGTVNIMDEKMSGNGSSVVTGVDVAVAVRPNTIFVSAGTCNLYGGTFKDAARDADTSPISRTVMVSAGATLNIYEGTVIDGSITSTRQTVYVSGGTLNMHGGTIIGRNTLTTTYGASVYVSDGTFNMSDGTIRDGKSVNAGGNVYITGGTFNMSGNAKIYGGTASDSEYDNVYITAASTMIMSGKAEITGDGTRWSALHVNGTDDNASTLVLKDQASILSASSTYSAGLLGVSHSREGTSSTIVIDPSWTGKACAYLFRYYQKEDETWTSTGLTNGREVEYCVVLGTYDATTGEITSSNEINGNLYAMTETRPVWVAEDGTLYIPGFSVETETDRTWYTTAEEAFANYQISDAAYIGLWMSGDVALTEDAYIAIMASSEPVVSGAYKLYAMDATQDGYAGTVYDWTVANETEIIRDVKNPVNGNRYLNITVGTGEGTQIINSTRLELGLKTVTLRAGKTSEGMGLYYKAKMSMSKALADKVTTYGVVLSLVDMPYANFADEGKQNGFTALETENNPIGVSADNDYTVILNSGAVFGIMKTEYETLPEAYPTKEAYNAYRGEQEVFANVYLEIDLDGDGTLEYVMADTDPATENDIAWSMYEVLDEIDGRWSDFAAAQEKLTSFYSFWYEHGMNQWSFDNIKKESV